MNKKKLCMKLPEIKIRDIIFLIMLIVYCLTASDSVGASGSMYKYAILVLGLIVEFFGFLSKRRKKLYCKNELKGLMCFVIVIIIYSLLYSLFRGIFSFRTIQEILFIVCPIIYAFLFVNNSTYNETKTCLTLGLIITFILYIFSLGMNFSEIYNAFFAANFIESDSSLESGVFSGVSLGFTAFFIKKEQKDSKWPKWQKWLSVLFVFMTFKRLSIITTIIMVFISYNKKLCNKRINNKQLICCSVLIFISSILTYNILQPQNQNYLESKYNIDFTQLTMTRSDRYIALKNSNYKSYGFGSSNEYMYTRFNGALEMDLIKIIVELGFLPLLIFIIAYLNTCKKSMYLFIFMFFKLISMNLTSCLTGAISWSLIFVIVFTISKEKEEYENINYNPSI